MHLWEQVYLKITASNKKKNGLLAKVNLVV